MAHSSSTELVGLDGLIKMTKDKSSSGGADSTAYHRQTVSKKYAGRKTAKSPAKVQPKSKTPPPVRGGRP